MIGTLWCKIFGHNFIHYLNAFEIKKFEEECNIKVGKLDFYSRPSNYCLNCGLTKKECGIKISEVK